jgi:anti-anti-sigma factor
MARTSSPSRGGDTRGADPVLVVRREGSRTVVSLGGEHDVSTAADLADTLSRAREMGDGDVVIDLSKLQFMDAAIARELARCQYALGLHSRALMLRAPSKFARRLLGVCGLMGAIDPVAAAHATSRRAGETAPLRVGEQT